MLPCSPIQDLSPCPPPRGDLPHAFPCLPHLQDLSPLHPHPGAIPPPCSHAPHPGPLSHAPHPGATSPLPPRSPCPRATLPDHATTRTGGSRLTRYRDLANSPGPANWLPPPGDLAPAPIWAATRPRRPLARSPGTRALPAEGGWSRITGAKQGLTQSGHPHMARPVSPYRSHNPQRNASHPPGRVSQSPAPDHRARFASTQTHRPQLGDSNSCNSKRCPFCQHGEIPTMGVVRAIHFSHTKWATWAGSWVTFCGLGRLRVDISRGVPAILLPHPAGTTPRAPLRATSPMINPRYTPPHVRESPPNAHRFNWSVSQIHQPAACMYVPPRSPPAPGLSPPKPIPLAQSSEPTGTVNWSTPSNIPCGLGCLGLA